MDRALPAVTPAQTLFKRRGLPNVLPLARGRNPQTSLKHSMSLATSLSACLVEKQVNSKNTYTYPILTTMELETVEVLSVLEHVHRDEAQRRIFNVLWGTTDIDIPREFSALVSELTDFCIQVKQSALSEALKERILVKGIINIYLAFDLLSWKLYTSQERLLCFSDARAILSALQIHFQRASSRIALASLFEEDAAQTSRFERNTELVHGPVIAVLVYDVPQRNADKNVKQKLKLLDPLTLELPVLKALENIGSLSEAESQARILELLWGTAKSVPLQLSILASKLTKCCCQISRSRIDNAMREKRLITKLVHVIMALHLFPWTECTETELELNLEMAQSLV